MAIHSSTLAWKIPWMEEPGRLQSMGSLRVGHDWVTSISLFTFHFHALEKEMAIHSSFLAWRIPGTGEPGGLPSVGVAQSWTRLKQLSSSSMIQELTKIQLSGSLIVMVWVRFPAAVQCRWCWAWRLQDVFGHVTVLPETKGTLGSAGTLGRLDFSLFLHVIPGLLPAT